MTDFQRLQEELTPFHGAREARSMARLIFEDAFGQSSPYAAPLSTEQQQELTTIKNRLAAHEPLQYILGRADFYGLQFAVDPRVLIPRPETEELVEWCLESITQNFGFGAAVRILDVGTGSGCIPITLKKYQPAADVWALDLSAEALQVAKQNAEAWQVNVQWRQLNILRPAQWVALPQFHLVVSNPPYIPRREAPLMGTTVKAFEPELALFVEDADPLLFYRALAEFSKKQLLPGGLLLVECNEHYTTAVADLLRSAGMVDVEIKADLSGKLRMVRAQHRFRLNPGASG